MNPISIKFGDFVDRYTKSGQATIKQVEEMKKKAQENGVSHLYLCLLHYSKDKPALTVTEDTTLPYEDWLNPL